MTCQVLKGLHRIFNQRDFLLQKNGKPLLAALHSADFYLIRKSNCKERLMMIYELNGFGFNGIKEFPAMDFCEAISFQKNQLLLDRGKMIVQEIPLQDLLK